MALSDLPGPPFAVPFDELPPDVADVFRWACHQDELRDQGVPWDQIPDFAEWMAARGR